MKRIFLGALVLAPLAACGPTYVSDYGRPAPGYAYGSGWRAAEAQRQAEIRDRREDYRDRQEDIRDRREDIRDARRFTGPGDIREDHRDRREDVRDRREDRRDRRD
jgi:hypothetical protein